MEYLIVEQPYIAGLQLQVNHRIAEGWKPIGGVCYTQGWCYQAMIKEEDSKASPCGEYVGAEEEGTAYKDDGVFIPTLRFLRDEIDRIAEVEGEEELDQPLILRSEQHNYWHFLTGVQCQPYNSESPLIPNNLEEANDRAYAILYK